MARGAEAGDETSGQHGGHPSADRNSADVHGGIRKQFYMRHGIRTSRAGVQYGLCHKSAAGRQRAVRDGALRCKRPLLLLLSRDSRKDRRRLPRETDASESGLIQGRVFCNRMRGRPGLSTYPGSSVGQCQDLDVYIHPRIRKVHVCVPLCRIFNYKHYVGRSRPHAVKGVLP